MFIIFSINTRKSVTCQSSKKGTTFCGFVKIVHLILILGAIEELLVMPQKTVLNIAWVHTRMVRPRLGSVATSPVMLR